jgi:hypothetical protein
MSGAPVAKTMIITGERLWNLDTGLGVFSVAAMLGVGGPDNLVPYSAGSLCVALN